MGVATTVRSVADALEDAARWRADEPSAYCRRCGDSVGAGEAPAGAPGEAVENAMVSLPVAKTIRALQRAGLWKEDSFTVTFVERGLEPPEGQPAAVEAGVKATIGKISIVKH